jgi:hypothetical protein
MGRHALKVGERMVLIEAYRAPFTIASNYARTHKEDIATLACRGLLTVFYPTVVPGHDITDHRWRVTTEGLAAIANKESDEA